MTLWESTPFKWDGILLHQSHSHFVPFLNLLAGFTIQCTPSKHLFSFAHNFLSFFLFCFFTTSFTTYFSVSSIHTASSFSTLPTAVFKWPTLHFFSFYCQVPSFIIQYISSWAHPSHFYTLSFSPQRHFFTFLLSLVLSLLFLSSVCRLKEILEMKSSLMLSVNSGIIFKSQTKQDTGFTGQRKWIGQMRNKSNIVKNRTLIILMLHL